MMPATLRSSSRSGQWMSVPSSLISQLSRSCGVPCHKRGYHISGAMIVRPSMRSTVSESSLTLISFAPTSWISTTTEFIPLLTQEFLILYYKLANGAEFSSAKSAPFLQGNGIQPELSGHTLSLHVNVRWLLAIERNKEEAISPSPKHSRHCSAFAAPSAGGAPLSQYITLCQSRKGKRAAACTRGGRHNARPRALGLGWLSGVYAAARRCAFSTACSMVPTM